MKKQLLIVALLGILFQGCAGLTKTGYLDNYNQLKSMDLYSKGYMNPAIPHDSNKSVSVVQPGITESISLQDYQKKMFADYLKQSLEEQISKKGLYHISADASDYKIESFIGKLDPGNGFLRWFFGFGLGRSDLQVEAKLVESATGELVASYGYRRQDAGNPLFGLNLSEMDNEKQVKNSMEEIAKSFTKFLEKELKKNRKNWENVGERARHAAGDRLKADRVN